MQEKDTFCLQCQKLASVPSNRLVQDTCGHKKCRSCLLDDEEKCKQCLELTFNINGDKEQHELENTPKVTDYHTAVIQCNGKARLNYDKVIEENFKQRQDSLITEVKGEKLSLRKNITPTVKSTNIETKKLKEKILYKKKSITIPGHVTVKLDPISYFCTVCNKSFLTKSHVKYHQYCTGELKPYKCQECNKEFITKVQLQLHMYTHGNIKPFPCAVCQKTFTEKSKLSRHMLLHSTERKYICPDCAKAFKSRESLRIHSLIHKNEKPFACTVCSSRFNNSSNLKKHLVSHTNERAHMCDKCGRRFKLKWALSVHKKSHLKVRPHKCHMCGKSFINYKDLQRHNLVHAESKGYACSICQTSFRRKDNLHRHMKNTHPGKTAEVIKNPVKAPDISKKPVVIDNPNAIKVITASPALTKSKAVPVAEPLQQPTAKSTDSRPTGSVINGPIKLAFKTPAFKSHYNIARDCNFLSSSQIAKPLPLSESIDLAQSPRLRLEDETKSTEICQKILSIPSNVDQPAFKSSAPMPIPQQTLSAYPSAFHYETSFQNRKHAMIKNIKFKVPEQYTNLFKQNNNNNNSNSQNNEVDLSSEIKVLKPVANTSVIVNTSNINQASDIHWRRRTSQNLVLKN